MNVPRIYCDRESICKYFRLDSHFSDFFSTPGPRAVTGVGPGPGLASPGHGDMRRSLHWPGKLTTLIDKKFS